VPSTGDMIPWTISQQFNDNEFATLSGARVVRIATHPDVQKMGYGSRAIDLLISYFQGEFNDGPGPALGEFGGEGAEGVKSNKKQKAVDESGDLLAEEVKARSKLPPLLTPLGDLKAEKLHWIGVSFGLTSQLLNFWSRKLFKVRQMRTVESSSTSLIAKTSYI
jgi:N-acetyltransferase 10